MRPEIKASDLMRQTTVVISGLPMMKLRFRLARCLFILAARVAGMGIRIDKQEGSE